MLDSGHYHRRKDIASIFHQAPTGDIHFTDLFRAAKNQATNQSEIFTSSQEAREKFELVHGNIVGVVGQAGMGKTTLTKELVQKILKENLYDTEYLFYLRFRDIDYKNNINLLQFLTTNSFPAETEDLNTILELLEDSEKVTIIMDGLDEAVLSGEAQPHCTLREHAPAETLLMNILSGNILPRARKLVTSRAFQLYGLLEDYKPKFIVKISGLTEDSQKQICRDICKNEDEQTEKVFEFTQERPDLKSFCFVPINCILIMYCVCLNLQEHFLDRMDSITTILVAALHRFIENRHFRGHHKTLQLKELSGLAYKSFLTGQLCFDEKDLIIAGINKENASAFLETSLGSKLKLLQGIKKKISYFTHLLLQEFFVALHIKLFLGAEKFNEILQQLSSEKFEIVTKILFGLFNKTTLEYLSELASLDIPAIPNTDESRELLRKLALDKLNFDPSSSNSFSNFLRVCSWLYEMREDDFTKDVIESANDEALIQGDILPSDIPCINYVFRLRTTPLTLRVERPNFIGGCSKQFIAELSTTLCQTNIQVSKNHFVSMKCGKISAKSLLGCRSHCEHWCRLPQCNFRFSVKQ